VTKKALCIGIDDYGHVRGLGMRDLNLKGCVNDANAWADLLVNHYDFTRDDIKFLTDAEATKKNIIKGIKDLLAGAQSGDVLVLTNSSHGTYSAYVTGDGKVDSAEEQQKREIRKNNAAFCPHDYPELIIDDELRELFDGVKTGVNTTFIADCCFSGVITGFSGTDTDSTSSETGSRPVTSSLGSSIKPSFGSSIKPPLDIGKQIQSIQGLIPSGRDIQTLLSSGGDIIKKIQDLVTSGTGIYSLLSFANNEDVDVRALIRDSFPGLDLRIRFISPELRGDPVLYDPWQVKSQTKQQGAAQPSQQHKLNEAVLTACTDKQMAGDAKVGDENHGFMTYHAIQTIQDSGYRLTYAQLHEQLLTRIKNSDTKYKDQQPCLNARMQREQRQVFT
jgi:hypothetical protein